MALTISAKAIENTKDFEMAARKISTKFAKEVVACALNQNQKFAAFKFGITERRVNHICQNYLYLMWLPWDRERIEGMTFAEAQWEYWVNLNMKVDRK